MGSGTAAPLILTTPSVVINPELESRSFRKTFASVSGETPGASAVKLMSASTPLPEGPGGRSTNESVTSVMSPVALSITPGLNRVIFVPDWDRNDPSVTEFALSRLGVNARSNCHESISTGLEMEIRMSNVSPTFTVAELAVIVGTGTAYAEIGKAATTRHATTRATRAALITYLPQVLRRLSVRVGGSPCSVG